MENEAGGRLRSGEWTKGWFTSFADIRVLFSGWQGISAPYIELGASWSVRELWMREREVESSIDIGPDGTVGKADERGMSGNGGEDADAVEGDENGSESELEPAALSSGVEGREPEMQTPAENCAEEVGMCVGLRRVRGCG